MSVQVKTGYVLESMTSGILETFKERADREGEGLLEVILQGSTKGIAEEQDSRLYNARRRDRR